VEAVAWVNAQPPLPLFCCGRFEKQNRIFVWGIRKEALWYNPAMNTLKDIIEHATTWPLEDQEKLAEYAREIEARRTGFYTMSDDERSAVAKGLAEADRGEFVADELVAEADKRHER
jgi:hypothetical protein